MLSLLMYTTGGFALWFAGFIYTLMLYAKRLPEETKMRMNSYEDFNKYVKNDNECFYLAAAFWPVCLPIYLCRNSTQSLLGSFVKREKGKIIEEKEKEEMYKRIENELLEQFGDDLSIDDAHEHLTCSEREEYYEPMSRIRRTPLGRIPSPPPRPRQRTPR